MFKPIGNTSHQFTPFSLCYVNVWFSIAQFYMIPVRVQPNMGKCLTSVTKNG